MKKIVVKIGTNVICKDDGSPDEEVMRDLVSQIAEIRKKGIEISLVSSGAVGFGKRIFCKDNCQKNEKLTGQNKVVQRQVFSAIGQIKLIHKFFDLFHEHGLFCGQILSTREDFRSRKHYLHMRDCVDGLMANGAIPILNENDTVSIDELMFSDNDELAGLTAAMIDADKLIILSSVDGLFTGNPSDPDSKLIKEISSSDDLSRFITSEKSSFGRGGMSNKCKIAKKIASMGIETVFLNGKKENILLNFFNDDFLGTRFLPDKKLSAVKKWIAVSGGTEKGFITVNEGAEKAIKKGGSILFVGITNIKGDFEKGDLLEIKNEKNEKFAVAVAGMDFLEAEKKIGKKGEKPFIRRDFIFLN